MKVITKRCVVCHKTGEVEVNEADWLHYMNGAFVQDAFPDMSADEREQIISGTHPECWDKLFGKEES